jgi:DNA (cytosine-5)-methyltransferase 1
VRLCTDISAAGRQAGLIRYGDGKTRSGLWANMCQAIDALRPSLVVAENVRALTSVKADSDLEPCPWCVGDDGTPSLRALGAVLGDLADIGYDAAWCGLRASDVGAPHGRFRIFITAWPATDAGCTDVQRWPHAIRRGTCSGTTTETSERLTQDASPISDSLGHERGRRSRNGRAGSADGSIAAANAAGDGRHERWPESTGLVRGSHAPQRSAPTAPDADDSGRESVGRLEPGRRHTDRRDSAHRTGPDLEPATSTIWGDYWPAIQRWERIVGRPAPAPTETGPKGGQRLSPWLPEWMMGLPAGHICDVPGLSRSEMLSLAGDGVVPQQAAAAVRHLLTQTRRAAA